MTEALGDRMKDYEAATRTVLPRRTYTILRVDGRAFHSYLRGAMKPYDFDFMADMDAVSEALCKEIAGANFAFTHSDEISLLITDFGAIATQPWFGGEVQKMVSTAAAVASVELAQRRPGTPTFDARVFTIPDPVEVANYFIWRQRDCVRNSISMAAQSIFSHRELHGVNGDRMQEMLFSKAGINWNDYPDEAKRGRMTVKASGDREVTFTHKRTGQTETTTAFRSWWETRPAPHFTVDSFLDSAAMRDAVRQVIKTPLPRGRAGGGWDTDSAPTGI